MAVKYPPRTFERRCSPARDRTQRRGGGGVDAPLCRLRLLLLPDPRDIPGRNYYLVPTLSSGPVGFAAFGLFFLLLTGLAAAFIPKELYGYYELSRETKVAIMLTVPALALSIALSVQLGTIFPELDPAARGLAFPSPSLALRWRSLWPVYAEALGGIR